MDRLDRYFGVHGAALTLRSERMGLLASNIANAATPGYKARDLDFSALLAGPAGAGPEGPAKPLATTSAGHIAAGRQRAAPALQYRQPVQASLDGNTVELATEQVQFAETAVRYRSTLSFLNSQISTLTAALKGE